MTSSIGAHTNKAATTHTHKQASAFKKIEDLSNRSKKLDQCASLVFKVRQLTRRLFGNQSSISEVRYHEAARTQEHLFQRGSVLLQHNLEFQSLLKSKASPGFKQFRKELDSALIFMKELDNPHYTLQHVARVKAKIKDLPKGESLIIDGSIYYEKDGHAMLMRLTRNQDDTFELEFANTGAGVYSNKDFHPQQAKGFQYQTVAHIPNIPKDRLLNTEFFSTYYSVAHLGKIPENSCLSESVRKDFLSKNNGDLKINLLYDCLRTLGNPVKGDENSGYYSRLQVGGSCAASAVFALSHVVLSQDEQNELESELKLKSFLHNYRAIKNGYDQSSTRKLMVLDQVQALKGIYSQDEKILKTLTKIESELLKSLHMSRSEVKISSKSKIDLNELVEPKEKGFKLKAKRAQVNLGADSLKAKIKWSDRENQDLYYQVFQDPDHLGQYVGKNHVDDCYLLYFAIANGDQERCDLILSRIIRSLNEPLDLKQKETDTLLFNLLISMHSANTRSDVAKKYCLALLLQKHGFESKNYPNYLIDLKKTYTGLNVEALEKDNVWVNAVNQLK